MAPSRSAFVLCIVALVGMAAVPGSAIAQEDRVTLTVSVVDQNGDAVSDVPISATWDGGDGGPVNETTRANGQALVDVPAGANVTIRVNGDEYVRNRPFRVTDASSRSVEVPVSEIATASVTVVGGDGDRVSNARVLLYRDGEFVTDQRTDSDGTVTTPAVEAGEYRLTVGKEGYYWNRTRIQVTDETQARSAIEQGSALLTVTVTDDHFEDPRAVQNATVRVPSVGNTVQTLSNGQATISLPVNDRYDLTVTKDGYETVEQRLRFGESDASAEIAIQRTPALSLTPDNRRVVVGETVRLRVTDEYGSPVPNATVGQNGEEVGTTDSSGAVVAPVSSVGNVTFTVEEGDRSATATVEGVEAAAADTDTATATSSPTATATETPAATDTQTTGGDGPGFTAVTVLIAFALFAVFALRRR
ncbi:carboxypeptidase regulatory-like domain-containing protein [Haloarcula nitratireducens]|uniref:Carboxypeptidase regulatory-like domain-containing protein n=1 Tax=Haloarcula nitratireducens TaxID=2487749 RepID=A0AAW4PC29_9EURY|nr:carboxypeptidase regulatory-like domain-containing protein [Halomicroarcula nitratireducens]MBX0295278.1 carboxypeptidase regulatory-like domain-containing protein [Halomicroarcula nitratireducens]